METPMERRTGRLQVRVYTVDQGDPVQNASVRIAGRNGGQTVQTLTSDSAGQTPIVDLDAPPVQFSLTPETEVKPYAEYDVFAEASGFQPVRVEGTQILSDVTAVQNIILRPEVRLRTQPRDIYVPQHTLWGVFPPKIPEEEVKPLPPGQGLTVLPQPVVPEYVVVHLGAPSEDAQNVWIPFKDYIKNVASSEIYSTWPQQSIRANVLAILSFTLNRVYTEWYRNRGYNFTITNSTAYDQAFSYGRNIFDSISVIVDELFTTFVTRPGIRQPLFTQYCDGSRVSCPRWLEQWGSATLARQGLDALSILRHYYGQNVFLLQAERVAGVPVSFPGVVLSVGSQGPAVRTIQQQLNAISNNYPAINKLQADGYYGEQTAEAVRTFQSVFGLPVTGSVDFSTWYEISNIFTAVERLAEL
jgi:hypothetical protein